ncbi:DUF6042 family protein, partial [Nonomuraea sp. MG754425]|uniref:DUF6042 family protein n=1 Tax=Nonomuraea sp. MG754425 TaxID=2570319 RepID=UPI001F38D112
PASPNRPAGCSVTGPPCGRGARGWSRCLGLPSDEVLHAVRIAALSTGRATGDEVAAAYQPWSSGSGDWGAALAGDLSDFAAQLGVPAPATRPDLLPLLVAAGLVIAETDDVLTRYRLAPQPPRAEDVLRLPAGEAAFTALPRPQEQPEPGRVRRMPGDVRSQVHEY